MAEPALVIEIARLLGKAAESIFTKMFTPESSEQEKADKAMKTLYPKLRVEITPPNFRILATLNHASNEPPFIIRKKSARLPPTEKGDLSNMTDSEINYRCKFHRLLGLVIPVSGSEYAISALGRSYVQKAAFDPTNSDSNLNA